MGVTGLVFAVLGFLLAVGGFIAGVVPVVPEGFAVFARPQLDANLVPPVNPYVRYTVLPAYNAHVVVVVGLFVLAAASWVVAFVAARNYTGNTALATTEARSKAHPVRPAVIDGRVTAQKPWPTIQPKTGLAIAGLVLGLIAAFFAVGLVWYGSLVSILAFALSAWSLLAGGTSRYRLRALAIVGLILGFLFTGSNLYFSGWFDAGYLWGPAFVLW
ncbi:hypothetical protein [Agromyces bauzanensis]